jgi:hypothetical protein
MYLVIIFFSFFMSIYFSASLLVAAGMGLTGWPVPPGGELTGGAPQPPSLACLRVLLSAQDTGKLEVLMDTMYLIERDITPDLVQGGRLRVFVECWLASHLRFWPQLKLLFPTSIVNENLRRAVISAGLAANLPAAADVFLDMAGSAVAEAFEAANIGLTATGAGGMQAVAAHQTSLSTQLAALLGAVTQQGVRIEGCLNQLGERVSSLQGVTSGLQGQLDRLSSGQPAVSLTAAAEVAASRSSSRRSSGGSSGVGRGVGSSSSSSSSADKLVPERPLAAPLELFTSATIAPIVAQLARASISCEPLAKNIGPNGPRTNFDSTTWSLLTKSAAALKALATPLEKAVWEKAFRPGASAAAGAGAAAGADAAAVAGASAGASAGAVAGGAVGAATAASGAPSFLVLLLDLQLRLAVRLDIEEQRLTKGLTASRAMTMNAFEGRLKKMRKFDNNVDLLFRVEPDNLTALIAAAEEKKNVTRPAATKRKRSDLAKAAAVTAKLTSSAATVNKGGGGKKVNMPLARPPPPVDIFARPGSRSSSSSSTSGSSGSSASVGGVVGEPAESRD